MGRWVSWLLVIPFAVFAALRLSSWTPTWRWASIVAFTPYVAAASLIPLLVALILQRWPAALAALATTAVFALIVMPRAIPNGNPPAHGMRLRVLASNVSGGQADAVSLVKLVRELHPDVLTIQELTREEAQRLDQAGLRSFLPHSVDRSAPAQGSGIYSRLPLTEQPMIELGGFRQARATINGVEIVSVHPCSPSDVHDTPCWSQGLRALPRAGGPLRVLAGDFNSTLDHPPLRHLLSSGYRDAADVKGQGLRPTWPQRFWNVPPFTLDHVLADHRIAVEDFKVLPLTGTDHHPVFAALRLP
ncbi:endonuclease/exonuclease/phosphatase family protein [Actinomadura barringtoniae]|uniref:Endonuclease/exonuclease/phosphatase family protein n=1 Tax=Actinomadura barringtoniae TaxID=1427535 RepID=A0A939PLY0_9ACTN|nr:endonuclease/exonuclease/phosphatase family protein [Actinomadura barringtoniae]MBO2451579.1 endonuclease/exonuclease/phosphatase family protein [Actinomadura barringtoniae]